jgi:hypothetical protein
VESFSDWQKLGNDIHGISADPQFVSSTDFHLRPGSPCVDRGAILNEPYAIDIDGEKRPQGLSFDLGAFEIPKQTKVVKDRPADFIHATPGSPVPASGLRMFDLTGRLVTSAKNGSAARHRILAVIPEGKQAYLRPVVKR